MSRLRNMVISMLALAGMEVVSIGLIGLDPLFSSGFEFAMTAFAVAWLAEGVEAQSKEGGEA